MCNFFSDEAFVLYSCSFETDIETCSITNYGKMKWIRLSVRWSSFKLFGYHFNLSLWRNSYVNYVWIQNLNGCWLFSTTITSEWIWKDLYRNTFTRKHIFVNVSLTKTFGYFFRFKSGTFSYGIGPYSTKKGILYPYTEATGLSKGDKGVIKIPLTKLNRSKYLYLLQI